MTGRIPAETFRPGEFIKEELEVRGWTQEDLAEILGRSSRLVSEIISGIRAISPEVAKGLGDAFGTGAQFWMNLESAFRLSLVKPQDEVVARRATIYEVAPVRAMVKRNWVESSPNIEVLEKRLRDFFNIKDISEKPQFMCAARKVNVREELNPAQTAWLFRASHLAMAVAASKFTMEKFNNCLEQLKLLLPNEDDVRRVPRILSDSGIRLLLIEPLPQSKIDGACFWLDKDSPVIALSLRYDRLDWFWFTLMHELGHVKNGDGKNNNIPIDTDLNSEQTKSKDRPQFEIDADNFAIEFLVPQGELSNFVARTQPLYSKTKIIGFANRIRIHPGIIVGQLQHMEELSGFVKKYPTWTIANRSIKKYFIIVSSPALLVFPLILQLYIGDFLQKNNLYNLSKWISH